MKLNLKKTMAEANIKRIKQKLEQIEELQAQSTLKPIENHDDTFMVATYEDEKAKLLKELEKNEKLLKS